MPQEVASGGASSLNRVLKISARQNFALIAQRNMRASCTKQDGSTVVNGLHAPSRTEEISDGGNRAMHTGTEKNLAFVRAGRLRRSQELIDEVTVKMQTLPTFNGKEQE